MPPPGTTITLGEAVVMSTFDQERFDRIMSVRPKAGHPHPELFSPYRDDSSVADEPARKGRESYGTIWVCLSCIAHRSNGECGDCHSDHGHDEEPLSLVKFSDGWETFEDGEQETNTYSTSQCEGCGTYTHGERHAMTLFGPAYDDTPAHSGYSLMQAEQAMGEIITNGADINADVYDG